MFKKHGMAIVCLYCIAVCGFVCFAPETGCSEEQVKIIRIAPREQSALVRFADGSLKVLHNGDEIPALGKITSISTGRISVRNAEHETFLLMQVDGRQSINKIQKFNPEAKSALYPSESGPGATAAGQGAMKAKNNDEKPVP